MYILSGEGLGQTQAESSVFQSFSPASLLTQGATAAFTVGRDVLAAIQLVQSAIARGKTDENELTNLVFFARHPERRGRKLTRGEPQFQELRQQWLNIREHIVRPVLRNLSKGIPPTVSTTVPTTTTGIPALGGAKVPKGFKAVVRNGVSRGLSRYGGDRLDRTLIALKRQGLISTSDDDIDTLQRIANVETGGLIQALNTWDSAVVSIGFMQWTLQHGKLQEWIGLAPAAFQRYGIALDQSRTYNWKDSKGNLNQQIAIVGAATRDELRWNGWAERFYLAGLDPEIIVVEAPLAIQHLQRHLNGLKTHLRKQKMADDFETFKTHYQQSLQLRGMFQAAYNNLPVAAKNGVTHALRNAKTKGISATADFLKILQDEILKAYIARNDNGTRIVTETRTGAKFN